MVALLTGNDAQLVQADRHQLRTLHQFQIGGARLRHPPFAMRLQTGGEQWNFRRDEIEIFVHANSGNLAFNS